MHGLTWLAVVLAHGREGAEGPHLRLVHGGWKEDLSTDGQSYVNVTLYGVCFFHIIHDFAC